MAEDRDKYNDKRTNRLRSKVLESLGIKDQNRTGIDCAQGPWVVSIQSPASNRVLQDRSAIKGWFILLETHPQVALRLKATNKKEHVEYTITDSGLSRLLRGYHKSLAVKYEFDIPITVNRISQYVLEINLGNKGWKKLCEIKLFKDKELTYDDLYLKDLSKNYAEHLNLISSRKAYYFEPEQDFSLNLDPKDPKLIAFYLPQFHPFQENDKWWGKGFTEWTNVAAAQPRFVGHEQPKIPADLGYYDLRLSDSLMAQINLAKKYGLHGFCFYYYWFSGKKLLDTPINTVLANKDWDFSFMICWANENWTRRWDGQDQEVLIKQDHKRDDPLEFIKEVEPILLDPRYIRLGNKPVLLVYRPKDLIKPLEYTQTWRQYFKKKHGIELYIIGVQSFDFQDHEKSVFDRSLDFAPLSLFKYFDKIPEKPTENIKLDKNFSGTVYDLRKAIKTLTKIDYPKDIYNTVLTSWDNDARRKGKGSIYGNSSPDLYALWLEHSIRATIQNNDDDKRLVFINAWNEWAEGAYLEPDQQYGHAYLNRTAQVLAKTSINKMNAKNVPSYFTNKKQTTRLAVVVHLYYPDSWPLLAKSLEPLKAVDYDLHVSIPDKNKSFIPDIKEFRKDAHIYIVPNRGRDVLPFVHIGRRLKELGYEYVLKIHSKQSVHREDGSKWLEGLLASLIPTKQKYIKDILTLLADQTTGVIGPDGHYLPLKHYFGGNRQSIIRLLKELLGTTETNAASQQIDDFGFFAGTMFWARLDALEPLLDFYFQPDDFETEKGQIDGTIAHALERLIALVAEVRHRQNYALKDGLINKANSSNWTNDYKYADRSD